jgi:hypothetical protein
MAEVAGLVVSVARPIPFLTKLNDDLIITAVQSVKQALQLVREIEVFGRNMYEGKHE